MEVDLEGYVRENMALRNTPLRKRLFAQHPFCYYCGIKVRECSPQQDVSKGFHPPDDMATIEHLYDRFDKRRYVPKYFQNGVGRVLCCYKCNGEAAKRHHQQLPKAFIERRADKIAAWKKRGKRPAFPFFLLQENLYYDPQKSPQDFS
jgi:hypothetical protein